MIDRAILKPIYDIERQDKIFQLGLINITGIYCKYGELAGSKPIFDA